MISIVCSASVVDAVQDHSKVSQSIQVLVALAPIVDTLAVDIVKAEPGSVGLHLISK
jgi:hypothetical protein